MEKAFIKGINFMLKLHKMSRAETYITVQMFPWNSLVFADLLWSLAQVILTILGFLFLPGAFSNQPKTEKTFKRVEYCFTSGAAMLSAGLDSSNRSWDFSLDRRAASFTSLNCSANFRRGNTSYSLFAEISLYFSLWIMKHYYRQMKIFDSFIVEGRWPLSL